MPEVPVIIGPMLGVHNSPKYRVFKPFYALSLYGYVPSFKYSNKTKRKVLDYLYLKKLMAYKEMFQVSKEAKKAFINKQAMEKPEKLAELLEYKLIDHLYKVEVRTKRNTFVMGSIVTALINSTLLYNAPLTRKCSCFVFIGIASYKYTMYKLTQKNFDAMFWIFLKDRQIEQSNILKEDELIKKYLQRG